MQLDDRELKVGFEVTRVIHATDLRAATTKAEESIRSSRQLLAALNDPSDPPRWRATEAWQLADDATQVDTGFAFYPEADAE